MCKYVYIVHDEAIKEKEYKTNELSLGRDFYRKYLGLDFQRIEEDRLRFVFNNIDPDDHARQFSFCVFINEKNKYQGEWVTSVCRCCRCCCCSRVFLSFSARLYAESERHGQHD